MVPPEFRGLFAIMMAFYQHHMHLSTLKLDNTFTDDIYYINKNLYIYIILMIESSKNWWTEKILYNYLCETVKQLMVYWNRGSFFTVQFSEILLLISMHFEVIAADNRTKISRKWQKIKQTTKNRMPKTIAWAKKNNVKLTCIRMKKEINMSFLTIEYYVVIQSCCRRIWINNNKKHMREEN